MNLVRDVLGMDAVAIYFYGSAVIGGLRPQSDLDLLVVSNRPTTWTDKHRLVRNLLAISGRGTKRGIWRRVDLTIVVEHEVRPSAGRTPVQWRFPPSLDFQYGDWLRSEFERGDLEPWGTKKNPDLAILITMAVLANVPLQGPPPAEVFDPVPYEDLVSAMVSDIDRLLGDLRSDTVNVILTLARIWTTLATGTIRSKDRAADWVSAKLPEAHKPVLARARGIYIGDHVGSWDDLQSQIDPLADYIVAEIMHLAHASS